MKNKSLPRTTEKHVCKHVNECNNKLKAIPKKYCYEAVVRGLLISLIILLTAICIAEATTYKNNLIHHIFKLKNRIPKGYIEPTDTQIAIFREAVYDILNEQFAGATRAANSVGYTLKALEQTNTETYYYILESTEPKRRPWGTYVFYLGSDKTNYAIEIPHPVEEKNTTVIGIESFMDSKATSFLLSGTRKNVYDVTLHHNNIFQAVHEVAASESDTVVLQIHGFNKRKYPQIVLTSGTPVAISAMDGLVDALMQENFDIGIYDGVQYSDYGATQNTQAEFTNSIGGSFIGIYLNQIVHHSKKMSNLVIDAIEEYTSSGT